MQVPPSHLARVFLRLGFTAFGGPAAHIAMMEREFVQRRGWIARERFVDMLGAVNLIPGPNSTELAIHIGAELGGRRGLLIAGACFILPAFSIVLLLAWLYERFGTIPDVAAILAGVKAVVLGIIAHAVWRLALTVPRNAPAILLAIVVFVAGLLGVYELLLLLGSGIVMAALRWWRTREGANRSRVESEPPDQSPAKKREPRRSLLFGAGILGWFTGAATIPSIFLYFLYVGSVLYGSGYVLIAFLRDDLVGSLGWLTEAQLLDAVSIGQVTPGPVFTTATFVGYLLGGVPGSIAATAGIFLPSFLFVLLTHGLVARLRKRPATASFLDGVNIGALALIAVALVTLAGGAWMTTPLHIVALLSLAVLVFTKINSAWLILAGAVIGWALAVFNP